MSERKGNGSSLHDRILSVKQNHIDIMIPNDMTGNHKSIRFIYDCTNGKITNVFGKISLFLLVSRKASSFTS